MSARTTSSENLAENGGVTEEQADCIAKDVFDADLSDDQIDALDRRRQLEDTDLSERGQTELVEVITEATTACITIE